MGYTLIISEKPSAAERIAQALAENDVEKVSDSNVPYYRLTRGGEEIVVAPAVGHLFLLTQKAKGGWTYPVFDTEWKPIFEANKKNTWSGKYYDNIQMLTKDASKFISATDYDIEGSVIAYNILRFICGVKDAKRMRFSTLTKSDLVEAYDNADQHLDFGNIEAGLTRHKLDFLWGINMSRALTLSLKDAGGYRILSTGRVQGPTLRLLEDREEEIGKFIPVPFWQLQLTCLANKEELIMHHARDKFWEKPEAKAILEKCTGQKAVVENIDKSERNQLPPFPFDLTTLQRESYSNFGYSPKQTLDIAQTLYEQALISYPRTSSQKLPAKLGLKKIIGNLAGQKQYHELCSKILAKKPLKPNEGKKEDSAHPAIFPTGHKPKKLNQYQLKVYDMIVRKFLAVFGDPATRETIKLTADMAGEKFTAHGTRTVEPGWLEFYGCYARLKDVEMPKLEEGQELQVDNLEMLDKETQPPNRYTQGSILKEMEANNLGTKATRANILHTLYERGYVKEKAIEVTELGKSVIGALRKYCPDIISLDLTKRFEEYMEAITDGKEKREDVINHAEKLVGKILEDFKVHHLKIGKQLLVGVREAYRIETTIGKCTCGGTLVIKFSRAKKRFVACDQYPKCTETFSLPHMGYLNILSETCKKCGLNIVSVKRAGKRPWKLCVRCGFVNKIKVKPAKEGGPEKASGTARAKPRKTKAKKPRKTPRKAKAKKPRKAARKARPRRRTN